MNALLATIKTTPTEFDRIRELLSDSVGPTRAKKGCLSCWVAVAGDKDKDGTLEYHEEWETYEGLCQHLRSAEFWNVLVALESARDKPTVWLDEVVRRDGLDALKEIRETA